MKSPPIEPLHAVVRALENARIACALGGSGLLLARRLADEAHDWDLTTDAPIDGVRAALADMPSTWHGSSGIHADQKLVLEGGVVECIVGFAIRSEAGVARIPTVVTGRWRGIPLGSLEAWAIAYALLGRQAKAQLLFDHLAARGADDAVRATLLRTPLPVALRERLASLPPLPTSSST